MPEAQNGSEKRADISCLVKDGSAYLHTCPLNTACSVRSADQSTTDGTSEVSQEVRSQMKLLTRGKSAV